MTPTTKKHMEKKQRHEMEAGVRDFWGLQREYGSRTRDAVGKPQKRPGASTRRLALH